MLLADYKPRYSTKQPRLNQAQQKISQSRDAVKTCEAAAGVTQYTVLQQAFFFKYKVYTLK